MSAYREPGEVREEKTDYVQVSKVLTLKRAWIKLIYDDINAGWLVVRTDGIAEQADEQYLRRVGLL